MVAERSSKRYVARLEVEGGAAASVVSDVLERFGRSVTGLYLGWDAEESREVYVELECDEDLLVEFVEEVKRRSGVISLTVRSLEGLLDFASAWRKAL
ncbi:MAG: hypothetical protein NZ953_02935 [Thaumarchaeota archaeon]|nr:hypothetical protein [Candidatus Calditenuaceae archaeon]MDW8042876.1 hypothetical protein [Nitrososphaerota archaeon]